MARPRANTSGAAYLAHERIWPYDLGERTSIISPCAQLEQRGGDPPTTAPLVRYPLVERLSAASRLVWWLICLDAGSAQSAQQNLSTR
jgi:hypothetical protein